MQSLRFNNKESIGCNKHIAIIASREISEHAILAWISQFIYQLYV